MRIVSPTVSGDPSFRLILHEVLNTLWEYEIQPSAWERSLLQPIFKNGGNDPADPASYRGIYLSSALAKLFEGILIFRLTQFTEAHNTLTENQLGTRPGCQVHDAIYILLFIIHWQHNYIKKGLPTYVAFLDYSTAFPSVFRLALLSLFQKFNIVGKMWKHLRARFHTVDVRVLHQQIPSLWSVRILRGLPATRREVA